jgi:hypothetical protein
MEFADSICSVEEMIMKVAADRVVLAASALLALASFNPRL